MSNALSRTALPFVLGVLSRHAGETPSRPSAEDVIARLDRASDGRLPSALNQAACGDWSLGEAKRIVKAVTSSLEAPTSREQAAQLTPSSRGESRLRSSHP